MTHSKPNLIKHDKTRPNIGLAVTRRYSVFFLASAASRLFIQHTVDVRSFILHPNRHYFLPLRAPSFRHPPLRLTLYVRFRSSCLKMVSKSHYKQSLDHHFCTECSVTLTTKMSYGTTPRRIIMHVGSAMRSVTPCATPPHLFIFFPLPSAFVGRQCHLSLVHISTVAIRQLRRTSGT